MNLASIDSTLLRTHGRAMGWVASFLLHSGVFLTSMSVVSTLRVVPTDTEPFRWDVSIVEVSTQPAAAEPTETPKDPSKAMRSLSNSTPQAPAQSTHTPPLTPMGQEIEPESIQATVATQISDIQEAPQPLPQVGSEEKPAILHEESSPELITAVNEDVAPVQTVKEDTTPPDQTSPFSEVIPTPEEMVYEETTQPATVTAKAPPKPVTAVNEDRVPVQTATGNPTVKEQASTHKEVPTTLQDEGLEKTPPSWKQKPVSADHDLPRSAVGQKSPSDGGHTAEQIASVPRKGPTTTTDYRWLSKSLWNKVASLKRYPHRARLQRWEGRVVLKAVIKDDGHLRDLRVQQSSGYDILDQDALELVRKACPLHLDRSLGRSEIAIQIPITYALH